MATDFIAGLNGGVAGVLVGHPFDTVKIRLQTQDPLNPRYRGAIHCFSQIMRQESPQGLYKGMATPIITVACLASVLFGSHGFLLRRVDDTKLSRHFLAGSFAGAIQSLLACPIEISKIKVQIQGIGERKNPAMKQKYAGSVDAFYKILSSEGLRGIYRGFGLTLMRDVPGYGISFTVFEATCRVLNKGSPHGQEVGVGGLLLAGSFAGSFYWLLNYPSDVMKTRFQKAGSGDKESYSSYRDVYRKSYQREGLKVFTKGLGVTMVRAFPTCAAIFASATLTKRLFRRENANTEDTANLPYKR